MKVFSTLADLKQAHLQDDTVVQIQNPTIIEGTVQPTGYGVLLASGNTFIPRLDDLETITARKCVLLDQGQLVTGFRKDNDGTWQGEVPGALSPTLSYGGQIWWPSKEVGDLPGDITNTAYTIGAEPTWNIVLDRLTISAIDRATGRAEELRYDRNDSLTYAPTERDGGGGTAIFGVVTFADSPVPAQNNAGYLCDTTDGEISILLPAAPQVNDYIAVGDYNGHIGTNKVTITTADSQPIMGSLEPFEIDTNYAVYGFSYIDTTVGWKLTTAIGESEAPQAIQSKARYTGAANVGKHEFATSDLYDVGYVDVYYNGIRLDSEEYTATNRTTVVLRTAFAVATDVLELVAYNHVEIGSIASVIETGRTATAWYRKWSDGFIEQGGRGVASTTGEVNTFLTEFSEPPIVVTGNHFGGSSIPVVFNTYTTTSFIAVTTAVTAVNLHWTASGF